MARSLLLGRPYLAMWVATLCVSSRSHKLKHLYCHRKDGKVFGKRKRPSGNFGCCNANVHNETQTSNPQEEAQSLNFQEEVEAICQILHENLWGIDTEEKLRQASKKLTANHVLEVLKRMESVEMSVGFFLWAGRQVGFKHNSVTYAGILKLVGCKQEFQCMKKLLVAMRSEKCKLNTATFNIIITSYGRAGLTKKAWETFSKMKVFRCVPDMSTYNTLLNAHMKKREWGRVKNIYRQMASDGPSPDIITYNTLMDGLTKSNRMNDAYMLLGDMIQNGYLPTTVSYNMLMKGLCEKGRVNEAHCLMSNMLKNGCKPTVVTHNTIIDGMCKVGRFKDAAKLFAAMHVSECSPETQTYTVMINGYTEAGKMEEAWNLFLEMKKNGCIPDATTYGVLMDGFCKSNRLEAAFEVLVEMLGRNIAVNTVIYTMFMDCLCKANKSELAHTILDDMVCNDCIPDAITYRALMNGLSKFGQTPKAYLIMMSLVKVSISYPSLSNFKALIDGLCKSGMIEEAMTWFDKLHEKDAPDIITYKLLVGSAYRAGRLDDSYKLLEKMAQAGFDPSKKYYVNLILGFCIQGSFDSACKVFEDLLSAKITSSNVTSKCISDCSSDGSNTVNACTLLYKALENAPAKHSISFMEVFRFLCQGDSMYLARELLEHMMDRPCFSTILDGVKVLHAWLSNGELQESMLARLGLKHT
ncbi:hypothetical protein L7F22_021651 [Adiantum nelumboides]|nr:hypothetical protein [Adiantum nelumboides]